MVSGFFPSTYHQGSAQHNISPIFEMLIFAKFRVFPCIRLYIEPPNITATWNLKPKIKNIVIYVISFLDGWFNTLHPHLEVPRERNFCEKKLYPAEPIFLFF